MTCIGTKGREIYSTVIFDSPEDKIFRLYALNLLSTVSQEKNLTITRLRFSTGKQAENQKLDDYVTELRRKAQ